MPSSERPSVKKRGKSERLTGKDGEKGVRRGEGGVSRMPSPSTTGEPMFCPSNAASLRLSVIDRHLVGRLHYLCMILSVEV